MKRNLESEIKEILYPNYIELSDSSKDNIKQLLKLSSDMVDDVIGKIDEGDISIRQVYWNILKTKQRSRKKRWFDAN